MTTKHSFPRAVLLGAICMYLLGCGQEANIPVAAKPSERKVLSFPVSKAEITVNGEAIDASLVEAFAAERGLDISDPAQRSLAARKLAEYVALAQDAQKQGFDASAAYTVAQIRNLSSAYVDSLSAKIEPTTDEMRAEYQKQIEIANGREMRLQMITFSDFKVAQNAERELIAGISLATVISNYQGKTGVLKAETYDWLTAAQLPPVLQEATRTLEAGKNLPNLVADKGIWHLLSVLETRAFSPPEFEAVSKGVRQMLIKQRTEAMIKEKLDQASFTP